MMTEIMRDMDFCLRYLLGLTCLVYTVRASSILSPKIILSGDPFNVSCSRDLFNITQENVYVQSIDVLRLTDLSKTTELMFNMDIGRGIAHNIKKGRTDGSWNYYYSTNSSDTRVEIMIKHATMEDICSYICQIVFYKNGKSVTYEAREKLILPGTIVAGVEGEPVTVNIFLPTTDEVNAMPLITVAIDHHDKGPKTDVVYIYTRSLTFKLQQKFESRLKVVRTLRIFELKFENATQDLAGTFRCYEGTGSSHEIKDCGHLLIILRKPEKPVIKALNQPSLGVMLQLVCQTQSTSLPHDHKLSPLIKWQSLDKTKEWPVGRIQTTKYGHLLLDYLTAYDYGLVFSCSFYDNANITAPRSERSDPYFLYIPECDKGSSIGESGLPSYSNLYITSQVLNASVVMAARGDEIRFKCNVRCNPTCRGFWYFNSKSDHNPNFQELLQPLSDELSMTFKKEYEGTYYCSATNGEGKTLTYYFALKIYP